MLNRSKSEAEQFIRENFGKISQKEMAFSLGVSQPAISQRLEKMGLRQGKAKAQPAPESFEQGPEAA